MPRLTTTTACAAMFKYLKASFSRKIARRVTKEYPPKVDTFQVKNFGTVQFANWTNPLVPQMTLNEDLIAFFGKFIKEGDLVIDIGANMGDTTVPMALCAGKNGCTIGFDPNPYVFKILEANAALNKDKTNIHPVRNAITTQEEEFYFISSEASFGNGGISPTKESVHGKFVFPEKIKGIVLENFLEKNYADRLSKFSFIKIDTEGYDKEILKSIYKLLERYKPVIIAESFGIMSDEGKMELYHIIDQLGYNVFYFADFSINAEVIKLNSKEDMIKWKDTINIYATPK